MVIVSGIEYTTVAMKKTLQSTGAQIVGKVITVGFSLFTIRLMTAKLGVIGYGNFSLLTAVFLLFDAAADLGSRLIGVREMVKAGKEKAPNMWVQLFWLRVMLTSVVFGVGLLFSWFYPEFRAIRTEAVLSILMLWGTMVAGSMEMLWQYRLKLEVKTVIDVLFPGLFLGWLVLGSGKLSLVGVLGAYLLARWVSLAVGWLTLRDFFGQKLEWRMSPDEIKRLLKESWPMGLYLLLFAGYDRAVDSMLIRHFWGIEPVAWYGLAYRIYSNLLMPAYFFMSSVFPLLSEHESQKMVYRDSRRWLLLMVFIGAPLIYWLAPLAIKVLSNNEYLPSITVLRILIIPFFFAYLNHLNGFWLISRGKQRLMLRLGIIVLVTNVVGNVILIPFFGIYAGAWMTAVSEGLMFVLTTRML